MISGKWLTFVIAGSFSCHRWSKKEAQLGQSDSCNHGSYANNLRNKYTIVFLKNMVSYLYSSRKYKVVNSLSFIGTFYLLQSRFIICQQYDISKDQRFSVLYLNYVAGMKKIALEHLPMPL